MAERKEFEFNVGGQRIPPVLAVVVLVLVMVALFVIARGLFRLLSILAIPALIATLIIDYKVVLGFIQFLVKMTRRNLVAGLVVILLSVLGYSLVSFALLLKAIFNLKVRQIEKQHRVAKEGELVDFEELDSKPLDLDRLPQREKQPRSDDEYDQFFEE